MRCSMILSLALLLGVCCVSAEAADGRTVTIQNPLGVDWKDELIHYDLEGIPAGAVKGAATAGVKADSGAALVTQVSDVARHEDGSVRSMRVWFQATVPVNGAATFVITPGGASAPPAALGGAAAIVNGETLELATAAPKPIAIRMPAGTIRHELPQPLKESHGPIQGLTLPSGAKLGAGRWEVPFKLLSRETRITAQGPLFAEATVRYTFDAGYWNFTVRVVRGEPMFVISEEFDTGHSGQLWNEVDRFYALPLNTGAFKPTQVFFTGRLDRDDQGTILKTAITPDATKKFGVNEGWFMAMVNGYTPTFNADRDDFYTLAYPSVLPRVGTSARFVVPSGDAIGIAGLRTDEWRHPMSLRTRSTKKGELLLSLPLQMYKQGWASDGYGAGSFNYTGVTLGVGPTAARRVWGLMLSPAEDEKTALLDSLYAEARKLGSYPLDKVKDWQLEWPDPMAGAKWAEKSSDAGAAALNKMRTRVGFAQRFGAFGRFSMAYHYGFAKQEYDSIAKVMNSPADLSAADRAEMRKLAAWNAYDMHQVDTFPWGTGFHLNNPNMSIMAVEARAKSSALIKDHPMFRAWGADTVQLLRENLARFSRDSGATYENPHYTLGVTFAMAMEANKILVDNNIGDGCAGEAFKNNVRFFLHWVTPPDPRFLGKRMVIPIGNCSYQSVPRPMATALIEYFKTSDPQLASQVQWWANQTHTDKDQIKIIADAVPALTSKKFDDYGLYFRHGFGTPYETMLHLFAGNCDGHAEWEADQMTYTLYAKGQPINLHFGNGYFPMFCRPWMRNRVSIDHKFEVSERNQTDVIAAAFNPSTEYARAFRTVDQLRAINGEVPILGPDGKWSAEESKNWSASATNIEQIPPTTWYRQFLFLKDADPKGPNYFVIRDTFGGQPTRPTDVSYWFLANKMERDGNTFRFDGQCKVDMDLFINTPQNTEPETGKHSHIQQPYGRDASLFDPKFHPDGKLGETQLFVRFKQPAGKGYMAVLYPRLKEDGKVEEAAKFTRLTDNVVRVETPIATDYALLDSASFEFKDDKVDFSGMATSVRFMKNGKIVVTNSEGKATIKVAGKTITGNGAFVVTIDGGNATSSTQSQGATVEVK